LVRGSDSLRAWYAGCSLHAGVVIADHDREALERLCRYGARPAFAHDRLAWTACARTVGSRRACRGMLPRAHMSRRRQRGGEPRGIVQRIVAAPGMARLRALARMEGVLPTVQHDAASLQGAARFRAGDIVDGRYRLVRLLGRGGMGEVWESQHATLERRVALKLVRIAGELRAHLLHEARLLASLQHPAIVAVHDAGVTDDGIGYLAMDVLVGASLAARLARGRLEVRDAVALFVELLGGLEAAHSAGIIHRDLKPDNILLVDRGGAIAPILIDFGIAVPITADGVAPDRAGTPAYMAPEQLSGMASTERSDVWAACISLYETMTGRLPFDGPDLATTAQQVHEAPLPFPTDVSGLDGKLWAILTRGIRKDPADRMPNICELRAALAGWLANKTVPPEAAPPRPRGRASSMLDALIRKKLTEG